MNDCPAEEMGAMSDDAGRRQAAALRNAATVVRGATAMAQVISLEAARRFAREFPADDTVIDGLTLRQASAFVVFRAAIEETT